MNISGDFLIIGNGSISKALQKAFPQATRIIRPNFDIRDTPYNMQHTDQGTAVICAAVTEIQICEAYPKWARETNVVATAELAAHLHERGWRVIMLSSNAAIEPTTEYGKNKYELEQVWEWGPILRLPKVLHGNIPLIDRWISLLKAGQHIRAHEYGIVQPVHRQSVAEAIALVAPQPDGIYSIAGPAVTWFTIARVLAEHLGYNASDVTPENKTNPYIPMDSFTMRYLGWEPPTLSEVIDQVIVEWRTE